MFKQNVHTLRQAICAGCLSQDRNLSAIKDLEKYAFFCYALAFDEKDWVCWECKQLVIKLADFRTRVTKAQGSLADLLNGHPCQIKSYSRLTIVKTCEDPDEEVYEQIETLDPLYYLVKDTVDIQYGYQDDESASNDKAKGDEANGDEVKDDDDAMGVEAAGHDVAEIEAGDVDVSMNEEAVIEEVICENDVSDNDAIIRITYNDHNYQPVTDAAKKIRDDNSHKCKSNVATLSMVYSPKPSLQPNIKNDTPNVVKLLTSNTGSKRRGAKENIIEVDNPFTVEIMSQEEMEFWRLRKSNMEFFTSCSPLLRCEECVEPFETQRMYTGHMKGHTQDYGENACDICQLRCHDEELLKTHKERHYKLLKCKLCEFQWDSSNGMRRHCHSFHGVPILAWLCDHCDREFGDVGKMMRHRTLHLARRCPECGLMLRSYVKKHMMRMHKHLPLLECSACGLKCKGNSGLQAHVKTCRNVADQTYCVECDIEYKNKYSYRAHFKNTLRHATQDQLKYQCKQCGRGFLDAASLLNHTDSAHDKQKKYLCEHCGKAFVTMLSRRKHERRVHSGRPVRKDKICVLCGKGFERQRTLLQHMNKHTGERPYKCEDCGAAFTYECALRNHARRKHTPPDAAQ